MIPHLCIGLPGIQTIFSLHFDAGMNNGIMNVDVDFLTNNLSEIPTVTINDQNIIEFVFDQGSILGELRNIDYSDTYNYSISAGGKTTSGIITMPAMPDSIRCNGSILIEGDNNNISAASSFHFTWECTNYDYFVYGRSNYNTITAFTRTSQCLHDDL